MFEDYLKDSRHFFDSAEAAGDLEDARRSYRASVIVGMSALEAFVNYLADTFAQSSVYPHYEVAFLSDRKFGVSDDRFAILDQLEYHRIEEKLRFLLKKYVSSFDFEQDRHWAQFLAFKKLRDSITHPRFDEDQTTKSEYSQQIKHGLDAVISLIDVLCQGIFQKPLRQNIKDLTPA